MIVRPIYCRKFIGREQELAFLQERRREAGASHGGLILISGDAGVGKSRLISEFCASLSKSRWRIGSGACLQFVQRPYGPILDVISRFDPAARHLTPAASQREQFNTITDTLTRAANKSAVIAIIEDLHWADAVTIELLAYLSTKLASMRLLMLVSLRPEEFHAGHAAYAVFAKLVGGARTQRIELGALANTELRTFIDTTLEGFDLPPEIRREVARAGEGNPFFTEELLKSALERSAKGSANHAALPTTIRATLLERLRPLTEEERKVLAQAAVIGRNFPIELLAQTLNSNAAALLPILQRARGFQLVEEVSPTLFRFRHALTREAIYGNFLSAQLQPLHRTIALALEAAPREEHSLEGLAYHWWAAGDGERSAHYNDLAGDAACAVFAHDDAIRYFERALETVDVLSEQRGRLLEKIAERRVATAFHDAALDAFAKAAAVFRALGDSEREAGCLVREAVQRYTGKDPHPTSELEAMLTRLRPSDYLARSRVHLGIAWLTITFYQPTVTIQHLERVDPRAIEAIPEIKFRFHNVRAWLAMVMGDADRFRIEHAMWLEAAENMPGSGLVASVYYNAGFCYTLLGMHDEAQRNVGLAMAKARKEHSRHGELAAHAMSAFCSLLRGDLHAAKAAVEAVRALSTDNQITLTHAAAWGSVAALHLDDSPLAAYCFDTLRATISTFGAFLCGAGYAEILVRRGRPEEARMLLHDALQIGERPRGHVLTILAVARYGAQEDLERARSILETAADAPTELVERHALRLFDALVAQREGRSSQAAVHAAGAAPGLGRLGFPLLEAQALELAGETEAALEIYRRCGATYDCRRLEPEPTRIVESPTESAIPASSRDILTHQERAIAALVARGESNAKIGHTLSISHKTVEKHLSNIYRKLSISSRAQLSAYTARSETVAS